MEEADMVPKKLDLVVFVLCLLCPIVLWEREREREKCLEAEKMKENETETSEFFFFFLMGRAELNWGILFLG